MMSKDVVENYLKAYADLKNELKNEPKAFDLIKKISKDEDYDENLNMILETLTDKVDEINKLKDEHEKEITGLKNQIQKLENSKKSLEKPDKLEEKIKAVKRSMMIVDLFVKWRKKNNSTTEFYYNWLFKDVEYIDSIIPGFASSWKAYRRDFNGLYGLVKAANEYFE